MADKVKTDFLAGLKKRCKKMEKLGNSQSLFELNDGAARIYMRYSKVHKGQKPFYGLRKIDLKYLEGFNSFICFLWNNQEEPLIIPYSDYEDVLESTSMAGDGQYKVQVYIQEGGTELYIARAGRFNVEDRFGWNQIEEILETAHVAAVPDFSHSQIQTLLGSIGNWKELDIWIPYSDRPKLDWSITSRFGFRDHLPYGFEKVEDIISGVDVIWLQKGSNTIKSMFEVEHSTPIYSGLLRFNDILLSAPNLKPRCSIVANDVRRSVFVRQVNRPTFVASGLINICNFLDYPNVFRWHKRISK